MAKWQPPFVPDAVLNEPDNSLWAHAVHCALLPVGPQGSVLHFCGNRWDANNHAAGLVNHTTLIDYATGGVTRPGSPIGPGGLPPGLFLDLFCCGHSLLPDGRLLVGGGTSMMQNPVSMTDPHSGHWGGLRECWVFDVDATPNWVPIASMNYASVDLDYAQSPNQGGGRWYPSLLTLGDGSVIAMNGHPRIYDRTQTVPPNTPVDQFIGNTLPGFATLPWDDQRHNNNTPDIFSLSTGTWISASPLGEGLNPDWAVFYPRLHVLPSGKLLIVEPLYAPAIDFENMTVPQLMGQSLVYDVPSQTVTAWFPGPQTADVVYVNANTLAQYTSSVLLPLLPTNNFTPRIMLCGAEQPVIATVATGAESSASWQPTAARQMTGNRLHGHATLLPTGEVFVDGGMLQQGNGPMYDATNAQLVPEIFNPATGAWRALTSTPATVPRGYQSSALLLPDGRVWTAGSEVDDNFGAQNAEFRVEIFEPDYIAVTGRTQITDAPPTVAYGQSFQVTYQPAGTTIAQVVVTRVGSFTHAFNYDQRYVGLVFTPGTAGKLTATAPSNGNMAPPGYYLLWLLDGNNNPCQQARFLRIGVEQVYAVMNRSTFSVYEVNAHQNTVIPSAFYIAFDGFTANDVANEPPFTVQFSVGGMSAALSAATASAPNPAFTITGAPQAIQYITFGFDLTFQDATAFAGLVAPDGSLAVTVTITSRHYQCMGTITLVMEPSPFMRDGSTWYLSTDLRVFQMTPAEAGTYVPGLTFSTPTDFIGKLITHLNSNTAASNTFFTNLPPEEDTALLTIQPTVDGTPHGTPVYNFALARVHLDGNAGSPNADTVRVMFRVFRVTTPMLVYDTNALYRRSVSTITDTDVTPNVTTTDAIPLLGIDTTDNSILAFPFFAAARNTSAQDMVTQADPANLQQLKLTPGGETMQFFGSWLDINQPTPTYFPRYPGMTTDFSMVPPANLLPIQSLLIDGHFCLVAEVYYKIDSSAPDLVHPGDTPASSDKLSQRNLAFEPAGNPGHPATRTVQHAFSLQPMSPAELQSVAGLASSVRTGVPGTHALIIWWQNVPRASVATLFLPQLNVTELVKLIPPGYAQTLQVIDEHTLQCPVADLTFIPLPPGATARQPALLSIELPAGIVAGQQFGLMAQQISASLPHRACGVVGSFKLDIPVKKEAAILPQEMNKYAILSHSLELTPQTDRWWPVLDRIVRLSGERVSQLGGDPRSILPSPYGAGGGRHPGPDHHVHHRGEREPVVLRAEMIVPDGTDVEIEVAAKIRIRVRPD
jgi:hypothetical protein